MLLNLKFEWFADGWVQLDMTFSLPEEYAEAAALAVCEKLGLQDATIIATQPIY